ncbi:MAG: glycerol kinase [Pseudomonadota bacterium]|nr:glycerol kinase [Pseudomonadota bacterium]
MSFHGAPQEAGCTLALDQGSHSSRAVLFDALGAPLASAHVPVGSHREGDDRVEQEPWELLQSLRTAALDACDSEAARGLPICGVGLATQRSTIVCWERSSGRALTEAISWQDRRNAVLLERMQHLAVRVREITGLPLSPHYGASKLRWCLDHVSAVQQAATAHDLALGPLSSYLVQGLVHGQSAVVDPANASRTLLFDPTTLDWSPELLGMFDLPREQLPLCVSTWHRYGPLVLGERRLPLVACTGDQSAAAFAFGTPDPSIAMINIGTGAFVQRVAPADAPLPDGLLRSVLCSDGTSALRSHEGTVNGAGSALEWLRGRVGLDVDRALAMPLPAQSSPHDPPLFMNGVGGLGAPFWQPDFPIEFVGDGDDAAQLAAVLESVAFLLCVNLESLRRSAPLQRIRVSGGLSRSDVLCRSLADLSGLPVERYAVAEATARGVAFLAAGQPESWQPMPVERVFTPSGDGALAARFSRWRAEMARRGAVA